MNQLLNVIFLLSITTVYSKSFVIVLPSFNHEQMENYLLEISDPDSVVYRQYLTLTEVQEFTKPSDEVRQPVFDWLKKYPVKCLDYGDSLRCDANVTTIAHMFNLKRSHHQTLSGKIYLPYELQDKILFVEGLINKKKIRHLPNSISKVYQSISPDPNFVGLETLEHVYQFVAKPVNGSVAAIEYQGQSGFSQTDLSSSAKMNSLSPDTVSHIVGVDTYPDLETQLDLQMEQLVAPNSSLWFWDDNGWLLSFATNFSNSENVPNVISMSWGWAEDSQCQITTCGNRTSQQYVERVNQEYVKIGVRGVSILVSSGDAGAPGRTSEACYSSRPVNPVMPGSSPWITSVSATFIGNSSNTMKWNTSLCKQYGCIAGTEEFPTNFNYTGWTTGGGFSIYDTQPSWQSPAVNNYLHSGVSLPTNFNKLGRAYPDVSAVGHNCPVVDSDEVEAVDGTSCSSPLFAGVVARLNAHEASKGRPPLGFLNPLLYKMSQEKPEAFHDVTVGNNYCTEEMCCSTNPNGGSDYGFLSAKGWDPVTGLGTPNVTAMTEYLDSLATYYLECDNITFYEQL